MGRIVAKLTSNAQIVKSDGCPLHSWCEIPTQPAVAGIGGQSPDSPVLRIIHRDRSWLSPLHVNRAQTSDAEKGGYLPETVWPNAILEPSQPARRLRTRRTRAAIRLWLQPLRSEEHTSELQSLRHLV